MSNYDVGTEALPTPVITLLICAYVDELERRYDGAYAITRNPK